MQSYATDHDPSERESETYDTSAVEDGRLGGPESQQDGDETFSEGQDPPDLDSVPITITVVAGRVAMNLEQVGKLRCGDSVVLADNTLPRVRLLANGRLIACGELIEVNGCLAVEITQFPNRL